MTSPLRRQTGLSCGAQRLGKTATLVPSFARRHTLDTGELVWTSVERVGTRGIRRPAGAVENMRRLGLIRPWDLVPSPSRWRASAAGRQRVFVGASGGVVARPLDCVWSLAIAGGPGPVRASVPLSRVLEAGVTPAVHSEGPAPLAAPS